MPADTGRLKERESMVASIESRGVDSPAVLAALRRIPRERFVPPELAAEAYDDCALQIACGQTISQPFMVAFMTQLLELEPTDRVLEIGTGSGYQTAILQCLCGEVYSVERHAALLRAAAETLESLRLPARLHTLCGDGSLGWSAFAPFDAILVTASGPRTPPALRDQLAIGGRLVAPEGDLADQRLIRLRRTAHGWRREEFFGCRFVRLVGAQGWAE